MDRFDDYFDKHPVIVMLGVVLANFVLLAVGVIIVLSLVKLFF